MAIVVCVREGQLSYALGQAVNLETDALLMIDKSSPRHKHDNRYKVDGESHASIHRIRADIADVDLGRVPLVRNNRRLVGTGKHLCGAATGINFGLPSHVIPPIDVVLSNCRFSIKLPP